jgi:hypothetical protein
LWLLLLNKGRLLVWFLFLCCQHLELLKARSTHPQSCHNHSHNLWIHPSLAKSTLRPKFDFSKLVPIKILQQEEWGTTSLASFSAAQRFALKKTGCAKISIKGVPSLTKLQSSVSDQIEALSELTHGKLTAYTYKFVESTAPIQLESRLRKLI